MTEKFEAMLARLEPGADEIYQHLAIGSIAISMKRIADTLEELNKGDEHGRNLSEKIYYAILNPLSEAMAQWARR